MKKKLSILILTGLLSLSMMGVASAVYDPTIGAEPVVPVTDQNAPRAEQTEWHYRIVDGKLEKRLWSLTKGEWLTDWMPFEEEYP